MEPKAFKYLLQKQEDMEKAELASSLLGESKDEGSSSTESSSTAEGEAKDAKIGIEKKKLEQALKHARLERQVPTKDMFAEVVDISAALSNQTRILYPKVAKKGQVLDDFLQRRLQLKTLEERRIELKLGKGNVFFYDRSCTGFWPRFEQRLTYLHFLPIFWYTYLLSFIVEFSSNF